jgi:hypothetical protein
MIGLSESADRRMPIRLIRVGCCARAASGHPTAAQSTLYEMGVLEPVEAAELVARWREEFQRAHRRGFFVSLDDDKFVEGARTRAEHFRCCDLPASLIQQWTTEKAAG